MLFEVTDQATNPRALKTYEFTGLQQLTKYGVDEFYKEFVFYEVVHFLKKTTWEGYSKNYALLAITPLHSHFKDCVGDINAMFSPADIICLI